MTTRITDEDVLIGQRLKTARLLAGLSMETLADKVGCTFQQITKRETGANRISAGALIRTAKALNISVASLFAEDAETIGKGTPIRHINLIRRIAALPEEKQLAIKNLVRALEPTPAED